MPDEIKKPKAKGTWIPFLAVVLFSTLVRYPIPTLVVVAVIAAIYIASKKGRIPKTPWSGGPGATIPSGGNSTGESHPTGEAQPVGNAHATGSAHVPGDAIPSGNAHIGKAWGGEPPTDFDFGESAEPTKPDDGSPARRVLLFVAVLVAVGLVLYLVFGQG
jgi:hypothetical protein